MSFKDIENQERVASLLLSAIRRNRLPHALLFCGPEGSGQIEMAMALTQLLFCLQKKDEQPCGECSDCHLIEERTHPDLSWLEPEEDSRVIKVEPIRELTSRSNLKPLRAPSKVFVIDHADGMNEVAQNALLKTLEEPEGSTYFVLISYALEKMLPTVRSRAQILNFIPSSEEDEHKASLVEAQGIVFSYCSSASRDQNAAPDLSSLSREEILWVLEAVIKDMREALLIGVGAGSVLGAIDQRPKKESVAQTLGEDILIERIERLADFKDKIAHSVNTKLALAVLWEKI